MGKNPNPARTNKTRTQVLPRTEPNSKVKNVQEPIDACRGNSRTLWSKLRKLMQPRAHTSNRLTADDFSQYFVRKIDRIRTSASASSPTIGDRVVSELLSEFQPVTTDEIAKILLKSSAKQCLLDPAPTWLIKQSSDIISPVITTICNVSFDQMTFPHC